MRFMKDRDKAQEAKRKEEITELAYFLHDKVILLDHRLSLGKVKLLSTVS